MDDHLLRDLIDRFIAYSNTDRRQSMKHFAQWLQEQEDRSDSTETGSEMTGRDLSLAIAEQWGRLSQYATVWGKLAFQQLPVNSYAEFGLLQYIAQLEHPTKSDLVERSMLEKSTCYEIIRRLRQLELIEEERDTEDGRIRRVRLTTLGRQWLEEGERQLGKIAGLLVGDTSRDQQAQLLAILQQLNDFHARLYAKDHDSVRQDYL